MKDTLNNPVAVEEEPTSSHLPLHLHPAGGRHSASPCQCSGRFPLLLWPDLQNVNHCHQRCKMQTEMFRETRFAIRTEPEPICSTVVELQNVACPSEMTLVLRAAQWRVFKRQASCILCSRISSGVSCGNKVSAVCVSLTLAHSYCCRRRTASSKAATLA